MKTDSTFILKAILQFFILISLNATIVKAQNWRTISTTDTNYFHVIAPTNSFDSIWNGYIRSIYTQNLTGIGNFEIQTLPYSMRYDQFMILDTITGHSWLGKQCIRNLQTGVEFFFNVLNDTIQINTYASLNDSWSISKDSNGNNFVATVTATDTSTIDGNLDSIKIINIQAYSGATPIINYYNGNQLVLSKNHGLIRAIEFYTFPNYDLNSLILSPENVYPTLLYAHQRLDSFYTYQNYRSLNSSLKYTPGNEWMMASVWGNSIYPTSFGLKHDSVISVNYFSPDTLIAQIYRHTFTHLPLGTTPPSDTQYHTYATLLDTIVTTSHISTLKGRKFELPLNEFPFYAGNWNFDISFISFGCNNTISVKDSQEFHTIVSGYSKKSRTNKTNIGGTAMFHLVYNGVSANVVGENLFYLKLGTCIEGTKLNFKTLSTPEIESEAALIQIYPNPSTNHIQVLNPAHLPIQTFTLFDITGKKILNANFESKIPISALPSGLYFLELQTERGKVTKKIIKN